MSAPKTVGARAREGKARVEGSRERKAPAKKRHRSRRLVVARPRRVDASAPPRRGPRPFQRFAHATSHFVGRPVAFCVALSLVVLWAATGPFFRYSDSWQLVINTSTTIITFLMVFLIQHTQNRDTEALRLKLDELIRAADAARDDFIEIDDLADEDLRALEDEFQRLRARITRASSPGEPRA